MYRNKVLLSALFIAATACPHPSAQTRGWDAESTQLPQFWNPDSKPAALSSPNGKLILRVVGSTDLSAPDYFLERDGRPLSPKISPYNSPLALWSPDSHLLAITSSDGGSVGNWKVYVYSVEGDVVIEHNVMKPVQVDLAQKFPAGINPKGRSFFSREDRERFARDPSWVNVFAVRWLTNPGGLLVEGTVPGSSGYGANMGELQGYVIDPITGAILHTYTEKELMRVLGR